MKSSLLQWVSSGSMVIKNLKFSLRYDERITYEAFDYLIRLINKSKLPNVRYDCGEEYDVNYSNFKKKGYLRISDPSNSRGVLGIHCDNHSGNKNIYNFRDLVTLFSISAKSNIIQIY